MASHKNVDKKLFGNCTIEWHINNIAFQMLRNEWLIQSPEFNINGSENTSWCMSLHRILVNNTYFLMFNLRRCAMDAGPKYVRLNLKMNFTYSNVQSPYCNKLLYMKNGSKYEVMLSSMDFLSKINQYNDPFTIFCDMIVYGKNVNRRFQECHDARLKLLSENMLGLYKSGQNFDIKLIFNDNVILAHRSILCARNEFLSSMIEGYDLHNEQLHEYKIMDLTDELDYEGMRNILAYLYTGDVRHILEEPSFAIDDSVIFLDIKEMEPFYEPDILIFKSTIDFQEYSYTLHGYSFENTLWMWNVDAEISKKTYRLLFYPNRKNCENYILLFTKTSEKPLTAFFEFLVFDKSRELRNVSLFTLNDESVSIDEKMDDILNTLLSDHEVFEIKIELKVSAGINTSYVVHQSTSVVSHVNKNIYYEYLSEDMELMLDSGSFTDARIDADGTYFRVHKCVLASRSPFFANMFLTNEGGDIIIPSNLNRHAICAVLTYIYTGVLSAMYDEDAIALYKAAIWVKLPQLKSICSDWLKVSCLVNRSFRCKAVRIAEEYEDVSLKKSVLNHLFDKKDIFFTPNNQHLFEDVFTCRNCS